MVPVAPASPAERLRRALRSLRAALPALIVGLPPLAWVCLSLHRAALTTLGRDQGIFQYVAWAISNGEVDYRDVRDVNGPLTHLVHAAFLRLGGRDELRFHGLDLTVTCISFAFVGACLPGLTRRGAPGRLAPWTARAAWAFAACVALCAQHFGYIYWDLAQRETFCDWFLLPSVALQLHAQGRLAGRRGGRWLLFLAGGLSATAWFGKPTFAAFTVAQLFALFADREVAVPMSARFAPFVAGCGVVAAAFSGWLLAFGDLRAFLTVTLVDVPAMYRFMWPRSASEIIGLQWGGPAAAMSLVTSAVIVGLIWEGLMPRRLLAIGVLPLVALAGVLVQAKGFPYHFHPVTASLHLQWLVIVVWASEHFGSSASPMSRVLPLGLAAALAFRESSAAASNTYVRDAWLAAEGATADQRESEAYFAHYADHDFFPYEMRQTAAYLRANTATGDRVQLYAMDPYVLFLAERRSATPYIYAYDLNADAALQGSSSPRGLRPTEAQSGRIRAMRDSHEADMLARLERKPPAAFVFIDHAPLTTYADAAYDFKVHCPSAGAWLESRYRETAAFGADHVWLRNDLASAATAPR